MIFKLLTWISMENEALLMYEQKAVMSYLDKNNESLDL